MMTLECMPTGFFRLSHFDSKSHWQRKEFQTMSEVDKFMIETTGETWDGSKSIPSSQ